MHCLNDLNTKHCPPNAVGEAPHLVPWSKLPEAMPPLLKNARLKYCEASGRTGICLNVNSLF